MQGLVTWPQVYFLSGLFATLVVAGFLVAWRVQELRSRDRHDLRSGFQQEVASLHALVELLQKEFDSRVKALEMANAGTLVVLKHIEEFKEEVKEQYEELKRQRETDMQSIHRRLDAMHNAARLINAESDK